MVHSRCLRELTKIVYEIELSEDYGVSPTFNVADLSPFHNHANETNKDLRISLFQPGEINTRVPNLLQSAHMDLADAMVYFSAHNVAP